MDLKVSTGSASGIVDLAESTVFNDSAPMMSVGAVMRRDGLGV